MIFLTSHCVALCCTRNEDGTVPQILAVSSMVFPKQASALTSPKYSDVVPCMCWYVLSLLCCFFVVFFKFVFYLNEHHVVAQGPWWSLEKWRSSLLHPQCIAVKAVAHSHLTVLRESVLFFWRSERKRRGLLHVCVFIWSDVYCLFFKQCWKYFNVV